MKAVRSKQRPFYKASAHLYEGFGSGRSLQVVLEENDDRNDMVQTIGRAS